MLKLGNIRPLYPTQYTTEGSDDLVLILGVRDPGSRGIEFFHVFCWMDLRDRNSDCLGFGVSRPLRIETYYGATTGAAVVALN
ncbi:hypothetical protein AWW66_06960 [Micromonospora rosaria]|uniref:Uncharacterized protein n=1 Tax=Micromonospora rosaria TaxID=47874 RepID=A0A136PVZ3_9ACTN|nr:hypothetical protein AWW66_06960 [Micromonospora rosaria]